MRRAIWVFAVAVLLGPAAMAQVDILTGGALVVHHEALIVFSFDAPAGGWCSAYTPYAISNSSQEVVRIDGPSEVPMIWYILAAWSEPKVFCGVQFGFTNYTPPDCWAFNDFEDCYPAQGGLEIPSANWPGPGEGTAFVASGTAWEGNWIPVYKFSGKAYDVGTYGSTVIQITDFDPGPGPFCGFSNCQNPPQSYEVSPNTGRGNQRGGMGINTAGVAASPILTINRVCCNGVFCSITSEEECENGGGVWYADLTSCTEPENPCDPIRACCYTNVGVPTCTLLTQSGCNLLNSPVWHAALTSCDPFPCPTVCCVGEVCSLVSPAECLLAGGGSRLELSDCLSGADNPCLAKAACCIGATSCQELTEQNCTTAGGTWLESISSCTPNPCPVAVCCVAGVCHLMTEAQCHVANPTAPTPFVPGEIWHPSHLTCDGANACTIPIEETTWGRIKHIYR